MPIEGISDAEMVAKLRTACNEAGGVRAWARSNFLSPGTVQDILSGRNDMSVKVGNMLGMMQRKVWVPSPFQRGSKAPPRG